MIRRFYPTSGSWFAASAIAALLIGMTGCASIKPTAVVTTPTGIVASAVAGKTLPTVVLQSGLGDGKDSWNAVFPAIAARHQVFAYDRLALPNAHK